VKAEEAESKKKQEEKAQGGTHKEKSKGSTKEEDDDPDGEKLAKTEDPLSEATNFVKNLQLYFPDDLDTHLLAIQVYIRKDKPLLVLQALRRAVQINNDSPELHVATLTFFHYVDKNLDKYHPIVRQVYEVERKTEVLCAGRSINDINDTFLQKFSHSMPHRLAVARVYVLDRSESSIARSIALVIQFDKSASIEDCESILSFITSAQPSGLGLDTNHSTVIDFRAKCHTSFPYTPSFFSPAVAAAAAAEKKEREEKLENKEQQ